MMMITIFMIYQLVGGKINTLVEGQIKTEQVTHAIN